MHSSDFVPEFESEFWSLSKAFELDFGGDDDTVACVWDGT